MALAMASPIKNKRGIWELLRRTPTAARPAVIGKSVVIRFDGIAAQATFGRNHIKVSLRTRDRHEAKTRAHVVNREIDQAIERLYSSIPPLTQEALVALAGVWYRELVADCGADPGTADQWQWASAALHEVTEHLNPDSDGSTAPPFNPALALRLFEQGYNLDGFLARHGIRLPQEQRFTFCEEAIRALLEAYATLERRAEGDYRPDPVAARFPAWVPPTNQEATPGSAATFDALVDAWGASNAGKASTLDDWRTSARQFKAFLEHDRPADVTTDDITRWVADMAARGLSPKTIKSKKLTALSALYRVGVGKKLVGENPFSGYPYEVPEGGGRERGYTDAEAKRLLTLASAETDPVRRWLPWLAALHGARISELAQLRREDIMVSTGIDALNITGHAGRVKNRNSERLIAMHPALVEMGFLDFVKASPSGPLFYDPERRQEGAKAPQTKTVTNRLREWIRESGFDDPTAAPNHAWRHRFSEVSTDVGADERTVGVIGGWIPNAMNRKYGRVSLRAMRDALTLITADRVAGRYRDNAETSR